MLHGALHLHSRCSAQLKHLTTLNQHVRGSSNTASISGSKPLIRYRVTGSVYHGLFVCFSKQRDIPRKCVCTLNAVIRDDGDVSARARLPGTDQLFRDRKHEQDGFHLE